jgi:2-polyprenyl-3-methyl-5-hydroxy-6-metoxy-1,4-benzoquinol methylase
MLNRLHATLHRPERGWDPVPSDHARAYAESEWERIDYQLVSRLEERIGGFSGKQVLDLGGGPGHYSVAFAQRGARVTWHDVSSVYRRIALDHSHGSNLEIRFSLGYLEEAANLPAASFDLVFCRFCWYYCMDDARFARLISSLVRPRGAGYVESLTVSSTTPLRKLAYLLNSRCGVKVGHPHPPHGRIAGLLRRSPLEHLALDYDTDGIDRVFWVRRSW